MKSLLLVEKTWHSIKCIIWVPFRPEIHPTSSQNELRFNVMEKKRTIHREKGTCGVRRRMVNSVPCDPLISACRQCPDGQRILEAQEKNKSAFFPFPFCCVGCWTALSEEVLSRLEAHVFRAHQGAWKPSLPVGPSPSSGLHNHIN